MATFSSLSYSCALSYSISFSSSTSIGINGTSSKFYEESSYPLAFNGLRGIAKYTYPNAPSPSLSWNLNMSSILADWITNFAKASSQSVYTYLLSTIKNAQVTLFFTYSPFDRGAKSKIFFYSANPYFWMTPEWSELPSFLDWSIIPWYLDRAIFNDCSALSYIKPPSFLPDYKSLYIES